MGVTIRIELRDDEGIFGSQPISQNDLISLLRSGIIEGGATGISGPFTNGGSQVFIVKIPDERVSWQPAKSTKNRADASTHD